MIPYIPKSTRRLLDIGCGKGEFARTVHEKLGAETWGIEPNIDAATHAKSNLQHVLTGSVESHIENLPDGHFDCISLNDVIEHLIDPWAVVGMLRSKLTSNGVIVASIPNIRHYKVLGDLLFHAEWRYTDSGVLDKTHLRFFTPKSLHRFFEECGYSIADFRGVRESRKLKLRLLRWLSFGHLWDVAYKQFAIVAKPHSETKIS